MTEQIEALYKKLQHLLPALERISLSLYRQEYFEANIELRRELATFEELLMGVLGQQTYFGELSAHAGQEYILFLLNSLLDAMERKEYVLLNDVLCQLVVPWCYEVQEYIVGREKSEMSCTTCDGVEYWTEYTAAGLPTLRIVADGQEFYLHSNRNAMTEAKHLADSWFREETSEYILFGMGLGYVAEALLGKSEYLTLRVYEPDRTVLALAKSIGRYADLVASGRVSIEADEKGTAFAAALQQSPEAEVCFFYPALRLVKQRELRERLEDAFIRRASEKGQYSQLYGNFKRNITHYDALAEELRPEFEGKRVYLVAAGPSLDKNVEYLKQAKKNGIVIAVGTVFKKLLRLGVPMDYVVVTDAKAPTFVQVEGVCDAGVPLLGLSTAYYRFFTDYQAKHYLLCQEGFAPAESFAAERGYALIQTGGSVITAGLDAAIMLGAKEIVFVGLDLAFTGGRDHASDTKSVEENVSGDRRMVEDIDGQLVPTARNLDMYRKFIEKRIGSVTGIRFVDATEGGARVKGTELRTLREMVAEETR